MPTIRHARPEDAAAIAAIWAPLILDTAATFNRVPHTPQHIAEMLIRRRDEGHAWIVAETETGIVGFATFAQFRAGVGYARTMEHTIILDPAAIGRGLGRRLIEALVVEARDAGAHSLIGAISGENPAAIVFHARCSFVEVGRIPEAGRKFERWLDLVLMQRLL